jgi:DNA-binding SARP family transcriptional activator/predicted ATPase
VKKMLGLLAYLALEGPTTRARLADLFWSEIDEASARRNLRVELHRLREAGLGEHLQGEERIGLAHVQTDVQSFEEAVGSGRFEQALALYRGALLEGLELPGAQRFWEWLEHRREGLAAQWRRAMLSQAENLETRGDWRGALEIHLRLLAEDSLQERHHREVMRLHYLLGEREAALARFERLKGTLRQELGLDPLPETLHLAEQIRAARVPQPAPPTLHGPPSVLPLRPPLVGREAAWERMEAAWAARQLVVITGEPGVGKSRLARDFALSKGRLQINQGRPTDPGVPFATLSRAVREMLQENPGLELPAWARLELSRLVPELGERLPPPLRSQEERLRLYEAFVELCDLATRGKAALFSDDVQFFDTASLKMGLYALEHFRERGGGRGLLAAFRKGELRAEAEALLRSLLESGRGVLIELEPLAEPQLLELVRRISGSGEGRLFSRRLYKATAGNPFFVLETLKTLFESGLLSVNAQGGWETPYDEETTDYRELPIPASVREAVLRRVDNLGGAVRRLLEAASLAGDGFRPETLQGATALTEWEGLEALERAAEARLLEAMPTGGYRFTHDLFAQSLADALSPERRRLLHLKLAASLERLAGPPARVAEHLEQAGKPAEAVRWRLEAARAAEAVYAYPEALGHYEKALANGLSGREAVEVRLRRAYILANTHQYEQHQRELEAAAATAALLGDPELEAQVLIRQGSALHNTGQFHAAIEVVGRGLGLPAISDTARARLLGIGGAAHLFAGELELAEQRLSEGLEYARDDPLARSSLHSNLCRVAMQRGDLDAAEHHNRQTVRLAAEAGHEGMQITALTTAAHLAVARGDTGRAVEQLERAVATARRVNHTHMLVYSLHEMAKRYVEQGELEAARAALEEGQALTDPTAVVFVAEYHDALGNVHRWQGRLGAALEHYCRALELVEGVGEWPNRRRIRLQIAQFYVWLGAPAQARGLLEWLEQRSSPAEPDAELEATLAWCDLAEGRLEAAQRRRARLEAALEHPEAFVQALAGYALARLELACGAPAAALARATAPREGGVWAAGLQALALRAAQALGQPVEPLAAAAEAFLASKKAYPLESLELRRALADAYAALRQAEKARSLRREAAATVDGLASSLSAYPELERAFLEHNRDSPG